MSRRQVRNITTPDTIFRRTSPSRRGEVPPENCSFETSCKCHSHDCFLAPLSFPRPCLSHYRSPCLGSCPSLLSLSCKYSYIGKSLSLLVHFFSFLVSQGLHYVLYLCQYFIIFSQLNSGWFAFHYVYCIYSWDVSYNQITFRMVNQHHLFIHSF